MDGDRENATRVALAIEADDPSVLEELLHLLDAAQREHAIWYVAAIGSCACLRWLVEGNGIDLAARYDGQTLLEAACDDDHLEAVRLLLGWGATLAGTPLHCAVRRSSEEIVRLLVEAGAWVDQGYPGSPTALAFARRRKLKELEAAVLAAGATAMTGQGVDGGDGRPGPGTKFVRKRKARGGSG